MISAAAIIRIAVMKPLNAAVSFIGIFYFNVKWLTRH
jgi:hypothetical protein